MNDSLSSFNFNLLLKILPAVHTRARLCQLGGLSVLGRWLPERLTAAGARCPGPLVLLAALHARQWDCAVQASHRRAAKAPAERSCGNEPVSDHTTDHLHIHRQPSALDAALFSRRVYDAPLVGRVSLVCCLLTLTLVHFKVVAEAFQPD